ncbi:hypothetical protein OIE13_17005 [Streptosporangium sp. NBC_01810]|uniref:hypothetical protein n=1 Tax=Streptosporangium sp. NBC_01810 TaxID=2975951 RepID=UPI002DDAC1D1|nr:hypothetical protein [Streptosporangium sp. NBC_01810]WSA29426.1 hypothetical protein OIE13_17005 [Streptosporangium sp. NBC_01810]
MAHTRTHTALFTLPITHSLGHVLTQLEDLGADGTLPPVAENLRRALSAFLGDYAPAPHDPTVWDPPLHLRPPEPLDDPREVCP